MDAIGEGGSQVEFKIEDESSIQSVVRELDSLLEIKNDSIEHIPIKKKGNKYSIEYETPDSRTFIIYYFDSETGHGTYTYFED